MRLSFFLQDGHSQNSEHSYDDLSEPSTELSIRISHREIHVHTGELITISSVVHSGLILFNYTTYLSINLPVQVSLIP